MNSIKLKIMILLVLLVSLIGITIFSIFGLSLSTISVEDIKKSRTLNNSLTCDIKINGTDALYDKNTNTYYHHVDIKYNNHIYVLKLDLSKSKYKYRLINKKTNIIKVDFNKYYDVIIYDDNNYYITKIQLTPLPLVSMETKSLIDDEVKGTFLYINSNLTDNIFESNIKVHVRGATSRELEKKSYKVNFYKKGYSKEKNINLGNFYSGDSLVLDSLYKDKSKVRNILSIDLWNKISNDFSNVSRYSEFVLVFINQEYRGLYVLTEPINRTKLNLIKNTKNNTSIIIKSRSWDTLDSYKSGSYDIYKYYYELKYPKDDDISDKEYDKILSKLSKYYSSNKSYDIVKDTFNIENYIDMIIFNSFINNADNRLIKNNYFYKKSINDSSIFIEPWDMEYTFGLSYDINSPTFSSRNDDCKKINFDIDINKDSKIKNLVIERYKELRKSVLTIEYIDSLLDKYKNILVYAYESDAKLYYDYDVIEEIEFIRSWVKNRISAYDLILGV